MNSISPNLNIMIKACEKASKIIIRDFGEIENLQVSRKGPKDFVTKTDKMAEKVLIEELSRSKSKFSFITEENGIIKNADEENVWIIDPIDGTTNFLHGIPHFAISVALRSHKKIISAVIFDPIKNEIFYSEKNNGSFFNNQRIRVSQKNDLEECLFGTNIQGVKSTNLNVRCSGSAALDLAYVSSGRLDGFFQDNLNIWDIAAGLLLIDEAGGQISNIEDNKISGISLLASSSDIHSKMRENFNKF